MNYVPKISIITAVYNGEKVIEKAITSIINQTYTNIEYIIIDGGSIDCTVPIVTKYQSRLHYFISEKDTGVYNAWNKGVKQATGDWLVFIGADDYLPDERSIENIIPDLQKANDNNIRYAYGKIKLLSANGQNILSVWGSPWEISKKQIFQHMSVTHCGAFHHKSLFHDYGLFNEQFKITGDFEFILREFSKGGNAYFINQIIVVMRVGGLSADLKNKLTIARENILSLKLNNLPVTVRHRIQVYKGHIANMILKVVGLSTLKIISNLYRQRKGKERIWL